MPKSFSSVDKKKWLELYDSGNTEASIAKNMKCDIRTIKKGIEEARRERDARFARAELVKDALGNHQKDLLAIIDGLLATLTTPPVNLRGERDASPLPIDLPGASATYEADKGWTVVLNEETTTLWELLRDHLKRDPMWSAIEKWKRTLVSHIEAVMALRREIGTILEEDTGLKLLEKPTKPPFLYYDNTVGLLYGEALSPRREVPERTEWEGRIVADAATGTVKHGGAILAEAPGREEKTRKNILKAFRRVQESAETTRVQETLREAKESAAKARRPVEEILLLGMVPGRCRVCQRLGV